jgi:hypothetical protein
MYCTLASAVALRPLVNANPGIGIEEKREINRTQMGKLIPE